MQGNSHEPVAMRMCLHTSTMFLTAPENECLHPLMCNPIVRQYLHHRPPAALQYRLAPLLRVSETKSQQPNKHLGLTPTSLTNHPYPPNHGGVGAWLVLCGTNLVRRGGYPKCDLLPDVHSAFWRSVRQICGVG